MQMCAPQETKRLRIYIGSLWYALRNRSLIYLRIGFGYYSAWRVEKYILI